MKKKFSFNSKVNITPSRKTYIFLILLNICLAATMIIGIIKIFLGGFRWEIIGAMALAFVIVTAYKNRPSSKEHYEAAIATIIFYIDELEIDYSVNGQQYKKYLCTSNEIASVEYSDRLTCLHISGSLRCYTDGKPTQVQNIYIYLDPKSASSILKEIDTFSNTGIKYMDR